MNFIVRDKYRDTGGVSSKMLETVREWKSKREVKISRILLFMEKMSQWRSKKCSLNVRSKPVSAKWQKVTKVKEVLNEVGSDEKLPLS